MASQSAPWGVPPIGQGQSALLRDLSSSTGLDLEAIRSKWKGEAQIQRQQDQDSKSAAAGQTKEEHAELCKEIARLDKWKICSDCQGQGYVETLYNHMRLKRNCEDCDGEGIRLREGHAQVKD